MSAVRIAAIVLIVAGIVGLIYGKFGYTKETHEAKLGSLELSVQEKRNVNVPVWLVWGQLWLAALFFLCRARKASFCFSCCYLVLLEIRPKGSDDVPEPGGCQMKRLNYLLSAAIVLALLVLPVNPLHAADTERESGIGPSRRSVQARIDGPLRRLDCGLARQRRVEVWANPHVLARRGRQLDADQPLST